MVEERRIIRRHLGGSGDRLALDGQVRAHERLLVPEAHAWGFHVDRERRHGLVRGTSATGGLPEGLSGLGRRVDDEDGQELRGHLRSGGDPRDAEDVARVRGGDRAAPPGASYRSVVPRSDRWEETAEPCGELGLGDDGGQVEGCYLPQ